jgi:hypothetical protein
MSADPLPFALDARVDVAAGTTTDARDIESGRSARDDDPTFFVIGFKVCIEETDHWMNRLATWGTGRAVHDANIDFSGQISHAEILLRDEDAGGEWIRYSILKRKGVRGRDEVTGKPVIRWVPATVHGIVTTPQAVKNYRFYRIDTTKRNARRAREFLEREKIKESGFNFWGYALNFVFPFKIGKNNVREASEEKKNSWFCTELVVCAMQRAEVHRAMALKACAVSPNQLHAFIEKFGVGKHVLSRMFLTE